MAKYNHAFDIVFSVLSSSPSAGGVTNEELIRALERRIAMLKACSDEIQEAVGEVEEAFEPESEKEVAAWLSSCPGPVRILIEMEGGLIQNFESDEADLQILVKDYDVDGVDPDEDVILEDEDGKSTIGKIRTKFNEISWRPKNTAKLAPGVTQDGEGNKWIRSRW